MNLNLNQLKVGDRVAVVMPITWSVDNEGIYNVIKVNKTHVVVQRDDQIDERKFSVLTGQEVCSFGSKSHLESVEKQQLRIQFEADQRHKNQLWNQVQDAVDVKDIDRLECLITQLKTVA